MKKVCLSLFAYLLFSFACFSQTTIKPGIGLNFSDFSKNGDGSVKGRAGWHIGGSVAFGKKIYVEPGIFYVGKSTEYTSTDTANINTEIKANIQGLRIPVVVGINVLGNEKTTISLRIFGGGSVFFVTSTGDDIDKDNLNSTNWGVLAGAGIDFWKLFVDLSYEWSLTNIQKDISQIDLGKSRAFFATVGLRINL